MVRLAEILAATRSVGGRLQGQEKLVEFDGFAFDSRRVQPGELFIAIRTGKADGHDHIADALRRGAAGLMVEREVEADFAAVTTILVDDTRRALQAWGEHIVKLHHPTVIAVTGSVGKTTTQCAIRAVLSQGYDDNPAVFCNDNYNDLLGLPIALSRLLPIHQQAILEMGSDSFGEVAALVRMAQPQIGLVTNVDPVHLQYLGSVENLAAEYGAMVSALPANGYAVLNNDDPLARDMAGRTQAQVVFYSREDSHADFYAQELRVSEKSVDFRLQSRFGSRQISVPLLGGHHVYTALAAAAVGCIIGLDLDDIAATLATLRPLPGRLNPLAGIGGMRLLDDTFSASPASMRSALAALSLTSGRHVALIGDMLGLGESAHAAHEEAGRQAAACADYLVARGDLASKVAQAARAAGMGHDRVFSAYTNDDVVTIMSRIMLPGDVVLVKGSEDARMEKIAEALLADSDDAARLPRQDAGSKQVVALHRERPTWLEIDLDAIAHNVGRVKEIVGPAVEILAVLKADSYGHGATRVAQTVLWHGATMLGTACLSEAVALRERGISAPIVVLGYTPPWQARDLVRYDIATAVYSFDSAKHLARAAALQGRPARVHLKVDTGMGRLGVSPVESVYLAVELASMAGIEVEGVFTHLATADSADPSYTLWQLDQFAGVVESLAAQGIRTRYQHAANSAALLTIPSSRYNLVRLGIALYGLNPSNAVRCPEDFRPALSFKSQVAQVKGVPSGACISYGCRFRTERASRIAVVPAGYGDGFRRGPANAGAVLIHGRRAPIVGVVCMDMCMVDVTDIPAVRQGDEVVLIGAQGDERISVEDVAERFGTINYEVVSQILARVPREVP